MNVLYAVGTVLGIAATLILRDWRDGKNVFTRNIPPTQLNEGFEYMKSHYNDTLTTLLTELQVGQKEVVESLRDIQRNGVRIKK